MMNQGGNTQTVASLDPNLVENRYVVDASQSQTSYLPTTTGSGAVSWNTHVVDNHSIENGSLPNSTYHHEQQTEPLVRNVQEGVNATSVASSSNSGTIAVSQDYSGYTPYLNSSDPYSYGNTGYPGYYSSYQQQPNHSYSQPVGAYQNTGAPYQPISSFPNSGSYPGSASYSGTYYHPGDYQKAGSYPSSSYNNQLNSWNEGNYANYNPHQYTNYPADASDTYNSGTAAAPAPSLQYQQQYNQWTDYYGSTEVSCAPGTENMPVATTSNQVTAPGVTVGYQTTNSQPPTTYPLPWQQDSSSLQMPVLQPTAPINGSHDSYWKHGAPSFQNHHLSHLQSQLQKPMESKTLYDNFQEQQKVACPQGPNSPYPTAQQAPQNFQSPPVQTSLLDNRRASNLQIPTNPRIASNLAIGLQKTNKDSSATTAAKPAYVCISMPKPNEKVLSNDAADSILKPGMFPKSLRGYVERALGRCKDDTEMATCQAVMKEIITKATADGTLYTRDWDTEPLFPLPNGEMVNKDLQNSTSVSALSKYKRSPSRRTKSRWEPLPEEKSINKSASASNDAVKFSGWTHSNEKDKKPFSGNMSKENGLSNIKILLSEQKSANKSTQRPVKRQRVAADGFNALDNGDASSDSDKEQSLTSYHSGAIALVNSPEERMRRENRSKRFEKGQGNRAETNHFKPRIAGAGNLYDRRASALVISKNYEDGGSRAVEDIDWDALTVKGTCQEIEKRYLRLTSAPDPSTVRPEEVLEKALLMVQNSQKNYLYKCDQLKSIRQDLTVQRIRNHLTVRVYETHARLAIEYGDLPEYNQCQSQLKILYAEGIEGCQLEFSAYNLLCVILHSNNKRELLLGMSRLSNVAKEDEAVKHALAVRAAVTSGNYVMFFRLYKTAPNLNTYFMDLYVEKMRFKAVSCMSRSYRPMVPVSYIAQVLGFASVNEGCDEKDTDGVEECVEWLKAHGASLVADNNGDLQVDAKASSSLLFMPEPEDAVSHGDSNLAVNDFLTRASSSTS